MERVSRTWWWELGVASLAIIVGLLLRVFAFEWALQETVPYVVFLAAIIAAAYYGGWKAGVWATLLGAAVCVWYWFPDHDPRPDFTPSDLVRFPLFVGAGLALSAIIHALRSAQRQARANEQALRSQQQLWRDTLASIGDGVVATDAAHRVILLNAVAEGLCGWTQEEAAGHEISEVLKLKDEQTGVDRENPAISAVRENRIVAQQAGAWLINRSGEHFDVEMVAAPIANDASSADLGAVVVFRDITRRREDERQLQEVDRRKDEFLATLAHELRTPLAVINNTVDVMQMEDDTHPRTRELTAIIDRQQQQLTRLIDDLVDVSRISRGAIALKRERIDLRQIVDVAVEASQPFVQRFEHDLHVEHCEAPLYVDADPVRINQVVVNLLNNAAKYTPAGGNITVTTQAVDGQAIVAVEDDGIGIAEEDLPKVFEMFSQVGQTLSNDHASLGIGLTVVKRLIEQHGGTINVTSDGAGAGSRFVVALPRLEVTSIAEDVPTKSPQRRHNHRPPRGTAFRILVVEDDVDSREIFSQLLTMLGHEVESAGDAESGWEVAQRMQPDIIFSDVSLPGVNGYEFARRIRKLLPSPNLLLVAVTGYVGKHDREKALVAGFDEYLTKPVSMARINELFFSRSTDADARIEDTYQFNDKRARSAK